MAEDVVLSRKKKPGWSPMSALGPRPQVKRELKWMSGVKMGKIEWLWEPYIPLGRITILEGDPGQGKSYISQAIAATLSRGDPLPGEFARRDPMVTLLLSAEDDPSDTIKPRLTLLGADQTKIAVYDGMITLDANGLGQIRDFMSETKAGLFVIDPIVAYLGRDLDMNRANEVRPVMRGLADIAKEFSAAGLVVRHLRKGGTSGFKSKALYSGMGSIDFTAAVRSELQVSEDRSGNLYLNHVKANAGPRGRSIKYEIRDDKFEWGEFVDAMPDGKREKTISRKIQGEDQAKAFLFDLLRDKPDGMLSADVFYAAKAASISDTKLNHVKKGLVKSERQGTGWIWKLDPTARPEL